MEEKKVNGRRIFARCAVIVLAAVIWGVGTMNPKPKQEEQAEWEAPPAASAAPMAAGRGERTEDGCAVIQTMLFSRCGHSVTRRVRAPEAVIHADFSAVQAYYDLWRLDSFSASQIVMSREIPLFCPMHQVLGVNEAGEIVLSLNVYGDGMAVQRVFDRSVEEFDEAAQEALRLGIGFEEAAAAEEWLASH